jgi:hypothetical protein
MENLMTGLLTASLLQTVAILALAVIVTRKRAPEKSEYIKMSDKDLEEAMPIICKHFPENTLFVGNEDKIMEYLINASSRIGVESEGAQVSLIYPRGINPEGEIAWLVKDRNISLRHASSIEEKTIYDYTRDDVHKRMHKAKLLVIKDIDLFFGHDENRAETIKNFLRKRKDSGLLRLVATVSDEKSLEKYSEILSGFNLVRIV